jgi:hypothetical protein
MRIMGKLRLSALARKERGEVAGAARALFAELAAADWRSLGDALDAFPSASSRDDRLLIPLDAQHSVRVAFNFARGIALIEYAGRSRAAMRGGWRS